MTLRRVLIGLTGLLMAGGGWDVMAADQVRQDQRFSMVSSPLRPAPERIMTPKGLLRPEAMPLSLNNGLFRDLNAMAAGSRLEMGQFILEPGLTVALDVTRVEPFAAGAQVVLMESDGRGGVREKNIPIPDQVILAGRVVDQPESRVVLAITEDGCNGYLSTESGLYLVASPADAEGPPVIYPVGSRNGSIELIPRDYLMGYPKIENQREPVEVAPAILELRSESTRSEFDTRALLSGRCCIVDPLTDFDEFGRPDDWTSVDPTSVTTFDECLEVDGVWHENGPPWSADNCNITYSTQITGACCLRSMEPEDDTSLCIDRTLRDCEALNGLFVGQGTDCSEGLCISYGLDCFNAALGIDTDDEFLSLFDGNVPKAINYIALLVGASSEIFHDNIRLRFRIRALRFWSEGVDPWDFDDFEVDFQNTLDPYGAFTASSLLSTLREQWLENPPPGADPPSLLNSVYLLSGRSLSYGITQGTLCSAELGYSVLTGLHGSFAYPVVDFHPDNWDLLIFNQVTGLLLGARYGFQYSIQEQHPLRIDECGRIGYDCAPDPMDPDPNPDPAIFPISFPPTIMSRCYICPGGVSNISMQFHPYVRGEMFKNIFRLSSFCRQPVYPNVLAVDDIGFTVPGLPVSVDVLQNDRLYDCFPTIAQAAPRPFLDIDTQGFGSPDLLDNYPRTTPLGGYLTTDPAPNINPNDEVDRVLKYMPPCDLFEAWECPTGNPLQNWPSNFNSTGYQNDHPYWSHYVDSFSYRANMNGTDSVAGKNDNSTVRMVVSPPLMSWPSACLKDIEWEPGSTDPDDSRIVLDLSIDVPEDPWDPAGEPYDVRVLSFGWLNLNSSTTFSASNTNETNSPGVCFEFYVDDQIQTIGAFTQICPWDPAHWNPPYLRNDNCGAVVFDTPVLNTNGSLRIEVVWNNNLAPPAQGDESRWGDGRVYVQVDDDFGACCTDWDDSVGECTDCECMSASSCEDMDGQYLGRGSACPDTTTPGGPPLQACTLVRYGACEFGTPGSSGYLCECLGELDCASLSGTYLGAGEPCPEYPGVPMGPACLDFDRGACCLGDECYPNNPILEYLTSADCEMWGGVFRGPGTSCNEIYDGGQFDDPDQNICSTDPPLALGACCLPDTGLGRDCLCGITTSETCWFNGGVWLEYSSLPSLGVNARCFAQSCDGQGQNDLTIQCYNDNTVIESACCLPSSSFPDGACLVTDQLTCEDLGGTFQTDGAVDFTTVRGGIPCGIVLCDEGIPTNQGACCNASTCVDVPAASCPDTWSFYPGLSCDPGSSCPYDPEETGACCLSFGSVCLDDRTYQDCLALEGEFDASSTNCDDIECTTVSQGICCAQTMVNGETYDYCVSQYSESQCTSIGGTWLAEGQRCIDNPCGMKGVCCIEEICYPDLEVNPGQTSSQACQVLGGEWKLVPNTPCETGICLDSTRGSGSPFRNSCDINRDGAEDVSDFLIIIQNYGQRGGRGDFNNDGDVTVDDLLDYLSDCP
ncbi:MAG: hypothetical protein P8M22_12510 [Phycisphaerales bacterium]|nr:hypothetical protein [Phycisphaerales bacterium]